jgi:hypothetical protein
VQIDFSILNNTANSCLIAFKEMLSSQRRTSSLKTFDLK